MGGRQKRRPYRFTVLVRPGKGTCLLPNCTGGGVGVRFGACENPTGFSGQPSRVRASSSLSMAGAILEGTDDHDGCRHHCIGQVSEQESFRDAKIFLMKVKSNYLLRANSI